MATAPIRNANFPFYIREPSTTIALFMNIKCYGVPRRPIQIIIILKESGETVIIIVEMVIIIQH